MKKKIKKFLKSCDDHCYDQACYEHERKIARKCEKKGYLIISKQDQEFTQAVTFYIILTKKGLKKVKKLTI